MRRTIIKLAAAVLMIFACQQDIAAQDDPRSGQLKNLDRVIAFVVQLEIHSNRLENRTDVCVGFGNRLVVDERAILSELRREKLRVRSDEWCDQGPRGLSVSIMSPATESEPGTYELRVELGDNWPISRRGAHFATLLRRGTYTVKYEESVEPELVRYQEAPLAGYNLCGCI